MNLMKTWGIRHQVLLLAVVPTLTVSILLVAYFTSTRLQDLEQTFYERGEAITRKLAQASEYGIFSRDTGLLQGVANAAIREHDVQSVTSYTEKGSEITSVGKSRFPFRLPGISSSNTGIFREEANHTLAIIVPITSYQEIDNMHSDLSQMEKLVGWLKVEFNTTSIHLRAYQVLIHTGILLLFGLSISGLHALQMGRKVTRPILELAQAAERIKDGDLTTRVRNSTYPELKILESGINAMAEALENAHIELNNKVAQATGNLRRSLETIEVQNIELELARQTAENASKIKSVFLADMSHEIRTPLNAVAGFIRLLKKTSLNEQQKEYVETLQRSASTLLSIINDILDFSKIEAGKLKIEQRRMDIRECLDETVSLMTPHANEKGISLIPLIASDVPQDILGDPLRIKQVLSNLLSNAIKFTEQGSVVLRVQLEQEGLRQIVLKISVTDTGIGLSEAEQFALFKAFNQGNIETSRKFGGTGLGLVICKKLVEQMNGAIGLESTKGSGTMVWFTVTASKMAPITLPPLLTVDTENLAVFPSLRVLAVDDNTDNLKLIKVLLEDMKIEVTAIHSGLEALQIIKTGIKHFDIILMDIRMPEFDGIQTTHAIRKYEKQTGLKHTPIIALTAHAFITEKEALLAAGVDDYLMKPLEEPTLVALLEKWSNIQASINPKTESSEHDNTQLNAMAVKTLTNDLVNTTESLKVIDWELGLKLAAHKPDLAQELLTKLIQGLPDEKIKINNAFQQKQWQTLSDWVHRLLGACCYCGVPQLKQATYELEKKLNHHSLTGRNKKEKKALVNDTRKLLQPYLDNLNAAILALQEAEVERLDV